MKSHWFILVFKEEDTYLTNKHPFSFQLTNAVRKAGLAIGFINCRRHENLKIISEKWILGKLRPGLY